MADAVCERVVDGGVAERAGDPDRLEMTGAVDRALDAEDGVELQQRDGDGWVVQIDLLRLERVDDARRKRVDVDLESHRERGRRTDLRDGFLHPQHVRPELLVAERVESKDLLSFPGLAAAAIVVLLVVLVLVPALVRGWSRTDARDAERQCQREYG